MLMYYYSQEHGRLNSNYMNNYLGIFTHEDALAKGFVPLDLTPPAYDKYRQALKDNGTIVENGQARVNWVISDLPRQTIINNLSDIYLAEIEKYFDKVAQSKGYNDRYTCSLRAGFEGPFKEEGIAFAAWMDNCYTVLFTYIQSLKEDDTKPLPNNVQEVINMFPPPPWEVVEQKSNDPRHPFMP